MTADEGTEIFILTPPTSTVITDLHAILQSRLPPTGLCAIPETSLQLLEKVQLLQYLDLAGLAEGLSEISQNLYDREQGSDHSRCVLLVQGLSSTLSSAQRRSGTTQVAAVASNLLRTLTHLSRTYPRAPILVEFTVEVALMDKGEAGVLESAFAAEKGEMMSIVPRGLVGEVIEHAFDVTIVVHDGFGKARRVKGGGSAVRTRVVEVVKDRAGAKAGEWCIWVQ